MPEREKVLTQLAEIGIGLDMAGYRDDAQCVRDALGMLRESARGWISVKERMPDSEEQVLIVYEWTGRSGAKYMETALNSFKAMRFIGYKPLFWMPLPEPPEEVNHV